MAIDLGGVVACGHFYLLFPILLTLLISGADASTHSDEFVLALTLVAVYERVAGASWFCEWPIYGSADLPPVYPQ